MTQQNPVYVDMRKMSMFGFRKAYQRLHSWVKDSFVLPKKAEGLVNYVHVGNMKHQVNSSHQGIPLTKKDKKNQMRIDVPNVEHYLTTMMK